MWSLKTVLFYFLSVSFCLDAVVDVSAVVVVVAVASHAADFASPSCRKRIFSGDRKERKKKFWQAPTLSGINEKTIRVVESIFIFRKSPSH